MLLCCLRKAWIFRIFCTRHVLWWWSCVVYTRREALALSVQGLCCDDSLELSAQGVKLSCYLHEACVVCARLRVCVVRILCCLYKAMMKFQTISSSSHLVKGDSACRWIESSSYLASSLFGEITCSVVVVVAVAFFFLLSLWPMFLLLLLLLLFLKKREKIRRVVILSLVQLVGRVYESHNCKDLKRNSNETKQLSFFERVMIGKLWHYLQEFPRHVTD